MTDQNPLPEIDDGDRLAPFDVREQSNSRSMALLIGAFALLLGVAFLVFKAYKPPTRDRADPPRIAVNSEDPIKVRPENPGGMQAGNQDKQVYSAIDGSSTGGVKPSAVTEEPLSPPQPLPKQPKIVVKTPAVTPKVATPAPQPAPKPAVKPTPRPAVVAPTTTINPGNSDSVVQVASVRSQEQAGEQWVALQRKFPSLLSNLYADVIRVDLGDKGIYYRVRIAGLAAKADANALCARFKASNQACFVTKK